MPMEVPMRAQPLIPFAAALLAGCAGSAGPCNVPAQPPIEPALDACRAGDLGRYLNVLPTAEIKAAIASQGGDRRIRYIAPGDAVTMDYSPSRLNVDLGADGRIKRFRCG
jgi:hypothetical protein